MFEDYNEKEPRSCYVSAVHKGKVYHLFDASQIPLGRMCAQMAYFIQGKHKPTFKNNTTENADTCIVVNASHIKMTGRKKQLKTIKYHTGYMGHLKEIEYKKFLQEKPEQLITLVTSRFLPHNMLRRERLKNIHMFRENNHTFTEFLPTFLKYNPIEDKQLFQGAFSEIQNIKNNPDEHVVIYETEEGGAGLDELKDVERDYAQSEKQFKDDQILKPGKENKLIQRKMKRIERIIKRYREYPLKQPKDRNPQTNKAITYKILKTQLEARRYGLEEHFDDDDELPEIEDETTPVK